MSKKVFFHKNRPNNACLYGGFNKHKLKKCGNPQETDWKRYRVCRIHYINLERRGMKK